MAESTETHLVVQGMTCGGCVKHVRNALLDLEGVDAVEVNLESGRARVRHTPETTAAQLVSAVVKEGYAASPAD